MRVPRSLRPAHLHVVADELWVVDAVQPVAAVLDPGSGAVLGLIGWPTVPAAPEHSWRGEWRALSDGHSLWVQAGAGPPARVLPDGTVTVATVRTTSDPEPWRLAAAGQHGAWLVGPPPAQDIASAEDAPAPDPAWHRLLVARHDGTVRQVVVEHAVHDAVGTARGVHLRVDVGRGQRIHLGLGHWSWEPEPTWLLLPWAEPVPDVVSARSHAESRPPVVPSSDLPEWSVGWHPGDGLDDAAPTDPQRRDSAGGLDWRVGRNSSGGHPWTSVATGHDPASGAERLRVPLGPGDVRAVLGGAEGLVVAISRPRGGAAVVRVDPRDGALTEIVGAGSVDVSAHVRQLGPRPADHDSYVRYWLRSWTGDDGAVQPAHEHMTATRAELVGEWPGTTIEITFDWLPYPGLRLRRRLPLFDELGRHTPPECSDVHLAEDLATAEVPDPADAVRGVLDV